MGGYYWPWMDWTLELTRDSSNSKHFFHEKAAGPNVKKEIGGIGIMYRHPTYALRFAFQKGKTTEMVYHETEYGWLDSQDTSVTYAEEDRPVIALSSYHISLSYLKYRPFMNDKVNLYYGGGVGLNVLKLYGIPIEHNRYDSDSADVNDIDTIHVSWTEYVNDDDWGFSIYPLVGLEYKVTPKLGIAVECQYIIGSTFNEKYRDEYVVDEIDKVVTIKDDWSYHFNTDGVNLQGSLYYYLF